MSRHSYLQDASESAPLAKAGMGTHIYFQAVFGATNHPRPTVSHCNLVSFPEGV